MKKSVYKILMNQVSGFSNECLVIAESFSEAEREFYNNCSNRNILGIQKLEEELLISSGGVQLDKELIRDVCKYIDDNQISGKLGFYGDFDSKLRKLL